MKNHTARQDESRGAQFLRALVPFLLFFLVFEIAAGLLDVLRQQLLSEGDLALFAFVTGHAQTAGALETAICLAAGFVPVFRTAAEERTAFRRQYLEEADSLGERSRSALQAKVPGGRRTTFLLLLFSAAFLSLGLNILLSLTGLAGLAGGAQQATAPSSDPWYPLLALLVYGVLSPYVEESVFRGTVYAGLRRAFAPDRIPEETETERTGTERAGSKGTEKERGRLMSRGTWGAALLSALLFAVYHGNPAQGIYAFLMGLYFAFAMELTGEVVVPVFLHAAANICVLLLSLLSLYNEICTPVWCVCFLVLGAVASGTLILFLRAGRPRGRKS